MKKRTEKHHSAPRRTRAFRAGVFACILLAVASATAIANFAARKPAATPLASQSAAPAPVANDTAQPAGNFVTVEVGGKRLRVNAQTLQQGPLTQAQSQQIADALKGNKSTDGLVEVQHPDGSVSMDLQGRFQNFTLAKKNDDGSVSAACVDTPEAATAFLQNSGTTTTATRPNGKAALQQ
ncbi:MAG TPA: hypothetical protein VFA21_01490 [Pyrinomonadaceae bacterium]|nr:hypothetical protein [Pyrinomonadaceae bacterium]